MVDRAVDRGRVEGLHERARPVVDGLAGDRHVVGVHDPVDEPDEHPPGHQRRLGGDHRLEQREVRALGLRGAGVVPGDRVVGEAAQQVDVAGGRGRTGSCPTRRWLLGDPGEHGARQQGLAAHRAPGRHHGEGAGRGDAEGVHRLADDVLAQHRADRGQAVAAARERRAPGALEVQVAQRGRRRRRARRAAARARRRGAGRSRRTGARRRPAPPGWRRSGTAVPTSRRTPSGLRSQAGSRPSSAASGSLSTSSRGSGASSACQGTASSGELAGEAVVEGDGRWRCDAHPTESTWGAPQDRSAVGDGQPYEGMPGTASSKSSSTRRRISSRMGPDRPRCPPGRPGRPAPVEDRTSCRGGIGAVVPAPHRDRRKSDGFAPPRRSSGFGGLARVRSTPDLAHGLHHDGINSDGPDRVPAERTSIRSTGPKARQ